MMNTKTVCKNGPENFNQKQKDKRENLCSDIMTRYKVELEFNICDETWISLYDSGKASINTFQHHHISKNEKGGNAEGNCDCFFEIEGVIRIKDETVNRNPHKAEGNIWEEKTGFMEEKTGFMEERLLDFAQG